MEWVIRRWRQFWYIPTTGQDLGLLRILSCALLFVKVFIYDISDLGNVRSVFFTPIVPFAVLHVPLLSAPTITVMQVVWKLALALAAAGLCTRWSTGLAALLGTYLLALPNNFGKISHYDNLIVLMLVVLALSRCGDFYSLDRWLARRQGRHVPDASQPSSEYTWPIRLVWVLMAGMFFLAGFAKLRTSGLHWFASDFMPQLLVDHQYRGAPATDWGLLFAQVPIFAQILAFAAWGIEFFFPLALFSRRAALFFVPASYLLLVGFYLLLGPRFLWLIIVYLWWVPWGQLSRWYRMKQGYRRVALR
jgi:hypothetical protein